MDINELANILKESYNNAQKGYQVASIHLFGHNYAEIITQYGYSLSKIIELAGLNNSYVTELSKGVKMYNLESIKKSEIENISVQEYFIKKVRGAGCVLKDYENQPEWTVYKNGKRKFVYVPFKNNKDLKLCLPLELDSILENIPIGVSKNIPQGQNGYTYPSEYPLRILFKNCELNEVKEFLDNILEQIGIISVNNIKYYEHKKMQIDTPLNQILYGPPGTGKTYNTVIKAMEIINGEKYDKVSKEEYEQLKVEFENLKQQGQIEFVTFHQSYSYEEFVEGIKPEIDTDNWGTSVDKLTYKGCDGVFKRICNNAKQIETNKFSNKIDFSNTKIFKMSLCAGEENKDEDIYSYCIENNVVALGWGKDKDFSAYNTYDEYKVLDDTWGAKAIEIFKDWMRIGDIILVSNGNSNIRAIAKITGDYEYRKDAEISYCQFRKVEWLYVGENIPINKIYDKKLSQQTIYGFYSNDKENKNDYNTIKTEVLNDIITGNIKAQEVKPYVLIIDEINRGNISKIFGELITLIEDDKRGEMTVTLPYSQKSFTVPKNLYIIGTMNTSDRSIASIDIALRRRFTFKEMMPNVELINKDLVVYGIKVHDIFTTLNDRISVLLDRDHQIGHSYFMKLNSENIEADFKRVWFDCIMPLLNEYFYGDWEKLQALLGCAKNNNESFIKKLEKVQFAIKYSCDEDETYDFVSETNINFEAAIKNAFSSLTKNQKSEEDTTVEE